MTIPAPAPSTAGHGLHPPSRSPLWRAKEGRSFPPLPSTASLPADRRGRLRNGAHPGDFLAAPRCGAQTRHQGCCRQPAMASPGGGRGRCRLHGGLSTGPRTAEGRARCARARLKHGAYSRATRALMAEGRAHFRRVRALLGARVSAGHGLLRQNPRSLVGAPPCGRPNGGTNGRPHGAAPTPNPAIRVHLRSSAVETPSTAGHGLLRSFTPSRPSARAARLLAGTAPLGPFSAGHLPAVRLRQAGGLLRAFPVAGQFRPNDGPARPAGCRPDGSW